MRGFRPAAAAAAVLAVLASASTAVAGPNDGLPELDDPVDRRSPRSALRSFLDATAAGNHLRAAYVLDLRGIAERRHEIEGSERARQLATRLGHTVRLEPGDVSDAPEGDPEDGEGVEELEVLPFGHEDVPITLQRVQLDDGGEAWVFSRQVVQRVPELYAQHDPGWIARSLPDVFRQWRFLGLELWQWLGLVVGLLVSWLLAILVASAALRLTYELAAKTKAQWDDRLLTKIRGPARSFVGLLLFRILVDQLRLPLAARDLVGMALKVAVVVAGAWLAVRLIRFAAETMEHRAARPAEEEGDFVKARAVRTQVTLLQRIASIVVYVIATALILLQFEVVRTLGMSLLASAGIAGVILGVAAQRSIAGLLAGLQVSITQPARIGDTVIVEGEWGTIEEINLTYVVVKVWDQRRLIVPMSRFLEQPFENWTKVSPELLGTIYFHADYGLPIDAVREELDRILEGSEHWDGRVKSVLVTDATERTVQVRALISAADAGAQWNLRCEVREKLIAFLQRYEDGRYLPRVRVEGGDEPAAAER